MVPAPRQATRTRRWLSIHEASAMLGVAPATLRRWSETGAIRTFTTPGGHRRFDRAAIQEMLPPTRRERPRLAQLGESPDRLVTRYRRVLRSGAQDGTWFAGLTDGERAPYRAHGRSIVAAILAYLDATDPAERHAALATVEMEAAANGVLAAGQHVPLPAAVDTFLRFRQPLLDELAEIARHRRLDVTDATALIIAASDAFDHMLVSLVESYGSSAPRRSRRPRPPVAVGPAPAVEVLR